MRIAYLIAQFPKPSETFIAREVLALWREGLDLVPFAFEPPDVSDAAKLDPATRALMDETEYVRLPALSGPALRRASWLAAGWRANRLLQRVSTARSSAPLRLLRAAALAERLQDAGIDHLHAHWPYATQVAWLVHRLTGLPFSVSIHAHEVEHDAGHFATVFDSLAFATFCNRAAMERLLPRLPAPARARAHLVYHGVDLERFAPLLFPREPSPLRVLSAGRLARNKGFDRLVRACAKFRAEGGTVELTILGQGSQEAALRQLAAELNFTAHLHLPGWLPHDRVAGQLAGAHLFALMADTDFHDGLPNVVLEAMACARPVALSPLPAASEAVTDGVEGFLLDSAADEAGMVAVLRRCAADPAALPAMGRAARRRVEAHFDANVHAQALKRLFAQHAPSAGIQPRSESRGAAPPVPVATDRAA